MVLACSMVCMNCLAWLRLNSSRPAVASPISRIPRRLFQLVLERVRIGISTQMSRFLNAQVATVSARLTIFPRVTLSRAFRRLLPGVGFRFAMGISETKNWLNHEGTKSRIGSRRKTALRVFVTSWLNFLFDISIDLFLFLWLLRFSVERNLITIRPAR